MMACGCKERCKRWRAALLKYEARNDARFKHAIKRLRRWLLRCGDE